MKYVDKMDIRKVPGTALINDTSQQVIYTPPQGDGRIRNLLNNWERFLHDQQDIDPLIRMAVMHYQFEAIHPFTDGNGRTRRILNLLFLISERLLDLPILYLSQYITQNKQAYYRLLLSVTTEQTWEQWILFMRTAVESTAAWTTAKIEWIRALMEKTTDTLREGMPNGYSRELVTLIFEQPYCQISNVVDAGIAQRQTASKLLKELAAKGLLTEIAVGREKIFINPHLMK